MKKQIIVCLVIAAAIVAGMIFLYTRTNEPTMDMGSDNSSMTPPAAEASNNTPAPAPVSATSAVKEFTITGGNFYFSPATLTVKKGDQVKIIFKNVSGFHDLRIDELGLATPRIGAGMEDKFTFTADKAGTFEYYCSVGDHRRMGMKGQLIVTE